MLSGVSCIIQAAETFRKILEILECLSVSFNFQTFSRVVDETQTSHKLYPSKLPTCSQIEPTNGFPQI